MSTSPRLGASFEALESRELPVVNPLVAMPGGESLYDAYEVRFMQEVTDVRTRLASLQPGTASTDVRLREELSEALVTAAWLVPLEPDDVVFGQPVEVTSRTPTLTFQASEEGYGNYVLSFGALQKPLQVLRNGTPIATVAAGTNQLPLHFEAPWYARETLTFKDPTTNQLVGGSLELGLNMYTNKIAVTNNRLNFGALAYNESIPLTQKTSSLQAGPVLDSLFADVQTVWNPTVSSRLTVSELQAAQNRLAVGTTVDAVRLRDVLITSPGVEAVLTPSFTFESGFNAQGRQVFAVNAENVPAGARFVMASDPWLKNVLDERSFLPGSNRGEFTWQSGAAYTGLVSGSGDLLGQAFRLSIVSNWLVISQGNQTVGQPGSTFSPAPLNGVAVPVTKDSLTAVTPSARLLVNGSSADLRFEWLPAGAVIEGLRDVPVVAPGGPLNVPIFVANGTQRAVTVRAADGSILMEKHMVGSNGQGGFVFYRWSPTAEPPKFITSTTFGLTQLATREEVRTLEAGRGPLASRPNPVFPAGSTVANQAWGLTVAGMTGIDLTLNRSQIARLHSSLVALWEDDRDGFYAEINRRYEATPIQSGRKVETAGMIERRMKGEVFDAYARADEAIRNALPALGDVVLAAFLNVQATRTDAPPPPSLAAVRTFTVQARNAGSLLPSDQELLTAIGAHFDRVRAYLAGEVQNWRNEVNEASAAGRITKDPNPGLHLPDAPQLIAYEAALTAVSAAEQNYRLAVAAGEPRRLSAAKVTLATAKAELVHAEGIYRAWQKDQQSNADAKPTTLPEGASILTLSKAALQRLLDGLPQKIQSVEARLQTTTDARLQQDLVAERAHWLALKEAATGLLALVPTNGIYPTIVGAQAVAWARYVGESVSGGQVQSYLPDGIGGSDADLPIAATALLERSFPDGNSPEAARSAASVLAQNGTRRQLEAEMLSWKVVSLSPVLPLLADVRQDTYAGRLLVVGFTHLWSQRDYPQGQWDVALRLQMLTDIPAAKLVATIQSGNASQAAAAFKALLNIAQYGHLFESLMTQPLVAAVDKPDGYVWGDREIRIRFDLQGGSSIRAANVYSEERLVDQSGAASFIRVPIASLSSPTFGPTISSSEAGQEHEYLLRLKVTLSNGQRQEVDVRVEVPVGWVEELHRRGTTVTYGDFSTLPEGQLRSVENEIFSILALPVTGGGWVSKFGSDAHDGQDLYAIDLSKDGDTGMPIHMPSAGVIERVNLDDGRVVIRHTTASGATWYSQFEHMTHILEVVTGTSYISKKDAALLPAEERLAADQARAAAQAAIDAYIARSEVVGQDVQIGRLGNEGSYTTGSHLHFSVYHADKQTPVNLYRWLDAQQPDIVHLAQVGGKTVDLSFIWDEAAVALVNAAERIALRNVDVADPGTGDGIKPERWAYAWEDGKTLEQMTRVVWQKIGTDSSGRAAFAWVSVESLGDPLSIWCKKDGIYSFISNEMYKLEMGLQ